ncbi:MAG: ferredoxin [Acidimicrobiales bacterium]|nr:ferredoxin [Acidimicrobiales bacterium]
MSDTKVVVAVDREKCQGAGVCSFHAPNTFDLDAECKAVVEEVADPIDALHAAAEGCPQRAITITELEDQ